MFRVPSLLLSCFMLFAASFAAVAQSADPNPSGPKLYCGAVTTELGWSGTMAYTMQVCPLNAEICNTQKQPFSLQPQRGRVDSGRHCLFANEPIKYRFEYNADYTGGRAYVAQELVPMAFDWRGLYPNVWCLEDAIAHFTDVGGQLALREGYFAGVEREKCGWEELVDPTLPPPDSDLPREIVGAWVPERKECPGFFDDASRTGDLLWIQPHGIDRAEGSCWLTGLFPLKPSLSVNMLCETKKGHKRTAFTFDRISGGKMRLREGRKRRVTYKRCEDNWFVDPEQKQAADKLKGQTLSFVLDLDTQLRSLTSGKTGKSVSQERKIELKVEDDGKLTDRMQIGDSATPKSFKTRFGEIAVDSDGDRATWLVEDGKLKRVRERKGYYEILSWPLSADGKSVTCEAKLEFAPTRSDGKLRSVATDRVEYDVVKAEITGQRCPTEPLSFAVAAADANDDETLPLDQCVIPTAERLKDPNKIRYELTVRNQCRYGVIVRVGGDVIDRPYLEDLPGAAGKDGRFQISRTTGFTLTREASAEQFLKVMEFSVLTADDYSKSCPAIDVEDTEKALACFGKTYVAKHGEKKREKPSADADTCIVNKTIGKAGSGSKDSHFLSITNDCAFEPVVAVRGPWLRGRGLISPAPSKESGVAIGYSWGVNPPAGANPDELLKQLEFAALSLEEFKRSCGAGVFDTDPELRFECFAGAYDKKQGKRDWSIPLWAKDGLSAAEEMERQAADDCIETSMHKDPSRAGRYELLFQNRCKYDIVMRIQQPGTPEASAGNLAALGSRSLGITFDTAKDGEIDTFAYLTRLDISALSVEDYARVCGRFQDDDAKAVKAAVACFGKAYVAKHGEPDWAKSAQEKIKKIQESTGCPGADPDATIKACTAEIDSSSGAAKANSLNNRGVAYFAKGDYETAVADYTQALRLEPKNSDAYRNRAIAYLRQEKYELAIADLDKTIAIETFAPLKPYRQRAEAYAALGEHAKAIKDADEALKIDPNDIRARKVRDASVAKLGGKVATLSGQPFDTSEKVHVRHILLKSESDAKLAEKVLKGGGDFAQTAKSLSVDEATAVKGGDLGWVGRGKMLKPFEDAAFALKPGDISAPVKTQFGWHIIKREER